MKTYEVLLDPPEMREEEVEVKRKKKCQCVEFETRLADFLFDLSFENDENRTTADSQDLVDSSERFELRLGWKSRLVERNDGGDEN